MNDTKTYKYTIQQFRVPLAQKETAEDYVLERLGLHSMRGIVFTITRMSLDNRRGFTPHWSLNAQLESVEPLRNHALKPVKDAVAGVVKGSTLPQEEYVPMHSEIHVVGAGPAGMWAALHLARKGYKIYLHEQGAAVQNRMKDIRHFVKQGILNPHSNVLYGEGGAGAFSDGKLTSRTRNVFTKTVLEDIAQAGGGLEVTYLSKPHLGTDRLQFIVQKLRSWIEEAGGTVLFNSRLQEIEVKQGQVRAICCNDKWIPCESLVLAVGHSARDVYAMLMDCGAKLEPKNFAVGVRVEHPQLMIDNRHFECTEDRKLAGAAEYVLSSGIHNGEGGAYSFCMCPGGVLVPCASEHGGLATNGMSYSRRNGPFANSGMVVPVEFAHKQVQDGIAYQRALEQKAFEWGGGDYGAPAQTIDAFLSGRTDNALPKSSYSRNLVPANLNDFFEESVLERLRKGALDFDRKIPGFIKNGLMVAPETRTSSPIRIVRAENSLESVNIKGLFPLGEGAGYAGGIVSSAADGVRLASMVKPLKNDSAKNSNL
jgi:uncharacterized protein